MSQISFCFLLPKNKQRKNTFSHRDNSWGRNENQNWGRKDVSQVGEPIGCSSFWSEQFCWSQETPSSLRMAFLACFVVGFYDLHGLLQRRWMSFLKQYEDSWASCVFRGTQHLKVIDSPVTCPTYFCLEIATTEANNLTDIEAAWKHWRKMKKAHMCLLFCEQFGLVWICVKLRKSSKIKTICSIKQNILTCFRWIAGQLTPFGTTTNPILLASLAHLLRWEADCRWKLEVQPCQVGRCQGAWGAWMFLLGQLCGLGGFRFLLWYTYCKRFLKRFLLVFRGYMVFRRQLFAVGWWWFCCCRILKQQRWIQRRSQHLFGFHGFASEWLLGCFHRFLV